MRSCNCCRHEKLEKPVLFLNQTDNYYCCELRNGWPVSHPILRALTCPAFDNRYKLADECTSDQIRRAD